MLEIQKGDGAVVTVRSLKTVERLISRGDINAVTLVRNEGETLFGPASEHPAIRQVAAEIGVPFPSLGAEPAPTVADTAPTEPPPSVPAPNPSAKPSTRTAKPKAPAAPESPPGPTPADAPAKRSTDQARPNPWDRNPTAGSKRVPQPPPFPFVLPKIEPTIASARARAQQPWAMPQTATPDNRLSVPSGTAGVMSPVSAFFAGLYRNLIAFGVGLIILGIGRNLDTSGIFAVAGLAIAALVGYQCGSNIWHAGARSDKALWASVIVFGLVATFLLGPTGCLVSVGSGAGIRLGWRSKAAN